MHPWINLHPDKRTVIKAVKNRLELVSEPKFVEDSWEQVTIYVKSRDVAQRMIEALTEIKERLDGGESKGGESKDSV